MASHSAKNAAATKDKDKRKAAGKSSLITTLKVTPARLRKILDPTSIKEESTSKEAPATSAAQPASQLAPSPNGENGHASGSTPGTPAAGNGTTSLPPGAMGPPTEVPKKKGGKRSAPGATGDSKAKAKPGPKKKARLDDGTGDTNGRTMASSHKLGPKANQGAINAGLRALDRSGKPCRKWSKGGFTLKSFTGVVWEIPRWTAPPNAKLESTVTDPSTSVESSNKENKVRSQVKSDKSNSAAAEGEPVSQPQSVVAGSSPALVPVSASSPAPMVISTPS